VISFFVNFKGKAGFSTRIVNDVGVVFLVPYERSYGSEEKKRLGWGDGQKELTFTKISSSMFRMWRKIKREIEGRVGILNGTEVNYLEKYIQPCVGKGWGGGTVCTAKAQLSGGEKPIWQTNRKKLSLTTHPAF